MAEENERNVKREISKESVYGGNARKETKRKRLQKRWEDELT